MTPVSPELFARWRSAQQVGAAAPSLRVTVTRGLIDKDYQTFVALDGSGQDFMRIVDGRNNEPWQGFWRATGEPIELPNVLTVKWAAAFSQKGGRSATIEVENIIYKALVGVGGIYHAILRGYLSPWLGMKLVTRPNLGWIENEWFEILDNGYRVDVYEGYGDQLSHTFTGLIQEADLETQPDRVTITARSFGVLLTDQRVLGSNKPPEIPSPLQIADRERTLGIRPMSANARASSTAVGRPVHSIVRPRNRTDWISSGHPTSASKEWVEVDLPDGFYEDIYLALPFAFQGIYISINCAAGSVFNGVAEPGGWIDGGKGNVPGEAIPFTNRWSSSGKGGERRSLGGTLQAKGTKVRVWLTDLPYRSEWHSHRAGVTRLAGMLTGTDAHPLNGEPAKHAKHWVLVDDPADAVKAALMWAGFHEWEVEDMGLPLHFPEAYDKSKYLIDIIEEQAAQGNWLFYEESPSASSDSLGVPCFVHNRAMDRPGRATLEVRDADLLESAKAKIDLSNLPYIIRYRGNIDPTGTVADGDRVKRFAGTYFPPWSGAGPFITESGRTAGVRRHELTRDSNLLSSEECILAAILAAIQYALAAYTAEFQISGYPGIELNQQISLVDKTTAINSRVWVASIQSEHTTGPNGAWKMTVGGALLDGEDMQQLRSDLGEFEVIVRELRRAKEPVVGELAA